MEQSKDVYKKEYREVRVKTTDGVTLEGKGEHRHQGKGG